MQLSITTDYAIRTVVYLATTGRVCSSSEISEAMAIPKKYIADFTLPLKQGGILCTQKGPTGGYALAKAANKITLREVWEAMEGTTRINRCLERDHFCSRHAEGNCPVRSCYEVLQKRIDDVLDTTTIQDLTR